MANLASQNTVHPVDDRVFSIRELLLLMNIPNNFKWSELSEEELNNLPLEEKQQFLKENEANIRECIDNWKKISKKRTNTFNLMD